MRRPVLYLAGLLMATGASLALAGPASAAVSHDSITSQVAHWDDDECDDDDDFYFHRHHRHHHQGCDSKKAAPKRVRVKRTPYIEEYPEDTWRPVILLREHKLPRRYSASDAKHTAHPEHEEPQDTAPSSRDTSPPTKRLPAWTPQQAAKLSKRFSVTRSKQRRAELANIHQGR